jgi:hypothetical protein
MSELTFMTTYCEEKCGNNAVLYNAELENVSTVYIEPIVQSLLLQVNKIDLTLVKARTMRVLKWDEDRANSAIQEYKKMLVMAKLGVHVVPGKDIDEIWHSHILFTINYIKDCDYFFGYYLNHKPSDGSTEEDNIKRKLSYINMLIMYKQYFCQDYPSSWIINHDDPCGSMGCDNGCTY